MAQLTKYLLSWGSELGMPMCGDDPGAEEAEMGSGFAGQPLFTSW